ncbi:plasma membrane fusion prm1 [Lecanosticta acicola]|uniref:Plasma membrane fusion protein PRM1 n=1 Tax=Lecanosticta acicola TaxID=111012 RepID=A0AAI8Z4E4_9PEZI|nr:plasma membrane fusion prm1 [Lecanosticta acicola]
MAPSENQQQYPNPAPPSPSAGGHETRDYYAAQDASRPPSQNEPYLTPYLGLRARLSQTWINRWTILLLLVLVRTLFAIASVDDNLGTARKQALSACTSVENVGSAMASMPHYMSQGINELTAKSIEKAINGLMEMLILTVTGVEEIVLFIINLLTSTYLCLFTFAIGGSLHVAVSVAEDVGDFLNSTVKDVGKDLSSVATDFQKAMNGFIADIDKIGDFLTGKDTKPPTIDLTSEISSLNGLKLPSDYDQGLEKLNSSIPTFDQVQNLTNFAIKFPFEEVKKLLNESLPKYTMNGSVFPVPAKEQLTFCSDDDGVNDFFDALIHIEQLAKKIFFGVTITLAVLAMIPMGYREIRRWRTMQERAQTIRSKAHDPLDAVYIVSRPYTAGFGLWVASKLSSLRRRALVRWSIAYATTVPALFVLSLAIAGLLGALCQYILLKALEKEVPALENQIIGFTDKVINSLNNASEQWAVGTNHIINETNTKINDDVFGWVNTTTGAINNTLNVFVDEMMKAVNTTFGGTVLYDPVTEVLHCLVLLKIKGIENGLTWVSDHAHIDIPMLPNDTFSLGTVQKVSGSSTDILATGPNGTATDAITDAVDHVFRALAAGIRQEAILSTCVLLIWVIIALIGFGRAFSMLYRSGDAGVYSGPSVPSRRSPPVEKYELHQVPTYEQATGIAQPGIHAGNKYNGHSYTLTPAPIPTFEVNSATSPVMHTGFSPRVNEKMGTVNGQNVDSAIRRPTHLRASSHGDYAITSPTSPPTQPNPFLTANEIKDPRHDPFADPRR